MQIIPAIDIIDGKCVRLTQGNYEHITEYSSSPIDMAKRYQDYGISRLHLVDLDGARSGVVKNWKVAEEIALNTTLQIDFGGGVKTTAEVKRIMDIGIDYVTVGSIAAKDPQIFREWISVFGPEKFLLGADAKDGMVMVSGWLETTNKPLIPFMQDYFSLGIRSMFCTDITKDGKLMGPANELYQEIKRQIPGLFLIASGGVSCLQDLHDLAQTGCNGAIVGKAIYESRISLEEIEKFIIGNINYAG
jgi:phosphoribosylformimino-5-aminoimidazole carboxamide ribotide isomerase